MRRTRTRARGALMVVATAAMLCAGDPFDRHLVAAVVPAVFAATTRLEVFPSQEGELFAPATVTLLASVVDRSRTVTRVDFYDGPTLIASVVRHPYRVSVTLAAGQHTILSAATGFGGNKFWSSGVILNVIAPLVQKEDLLYQGAFRLPGLDWGVATFAYGGRALAFSPERNSLFLVGHTHHQQVAEISIPEIRRTPTVSGLAKASFLQPLTDMTEGRLPSINPTDPNSKLIGGLLPYAGRLYMTAYSYYDGAGTQKLSHFSSGFNLATSGDLNGPYAIGPKAGYVSGYMGRVPPAWQTAFGGPVLTGQCCLAIVSRTSYGPALFAIDPLQLGGPSPTATPLVYYPSSNPLGQWDSTNPYFNGSTSVTGVVFPENTRTVLFFGRHGLGPFCYGTGEECHDPSESSKGTHGYPYAPYVWAYNAADLADAAQGRRQPWEVKPYATWTLDTGYPSWNASLMGATYDPATGRIFVIQANGDGLLPLIHVFTVKRR